MSRRFLNVPLGIWLGFLAVSTLFVLYPRIDLAVASVFYTPGAGFEVNGTWYERLVYTSVEVLVTAVGVGLVLLWGYGRLMNRRRLRPNGRELGFLLLLLALGPGLIVNLGLKENWGRARPVQLTQFGGAREFTPAFVLSDVGGGSFPSGHVAAAAWLFIAALLLSRGRRGWMSLMLAYCLLVGLVRMAAGGHFASDVLIALFIVVILALMLHGLLCRDHGTTHSVDPAPEEESAA